MICSISSIIVARMAGVIGRTSSVDVGECGRARDFKHHMAITVSTDVSWVLIVMSTISSVAIVVDLNSSNLRLESLEVCPRTRLSLK